MQKAATGRLTRFGHMATQIVSRPFRLDHTWQREIFAVAAVGFSAFYLTAVLSFTPADATFVSASWPEAASQNLAGSIGSRIAGLAVFLLGGVALFAPLPLLAAAISLLRRSERPFPWTKALGWLIVLGLLTAVAASRLPLLTVEGFAVPSGGLVGEVVSQTLNRNFGSVGTIIALISFGICGLLLVFERSMLLPISTALRAQLSRMSFRNIFRKTKVDPSQDQQIAPVGAPPALFARGIDPIFGEATPDPIFGAPAEVLGKNAAFQHEPQEIVVNPPTQTAVVVPPPATIETPKQSVRPGPTIEHVSVALDVVEDTAETPRMREHAAPAVERDLKLPEKPKSTYVAPPVSIFQTAQGVMSQASVNMRELESTGQLLTKTFADFGVTGKIVGYQPGPVVTTFEFQPEAGVKQSKVLGLIDDIALALKVDSIFIHPVTGKRALGIQVPNPKRETVYLGDVLSAPEFINTISPLTFGMGKTISGQPIVADLTTMPHLLMAGATGTGKSVAINALLCSIVMKASPDDVRLILVDPKMLELSVYEGVPHLLMPVITEPTRASMALKWAAAEMERRYKLMQHACVRNISGFNALWSQASEDRRRELQDVMGDDSIGKLPYILLVIDELADLMLTAPKDVEGSIQRLAQKARASGIHMVLATQRPSVDVITGVIKANLPCRISFQVVSKHDSRTILDQIGSEKLLGKGDMLFQKPGVGRIERIQGALISDEEVLSLVANAKASATAEYDESIMSWIDEEVARAASQDGEGAVDLEGMDDDPKYDEAVTIARTHGVVSASFLQRHLKIGYNRAARIVEFMEAKGYVAKAEGAKPRRWLGPAA